MSSTKQLKSKKVRSKLKAVGASTNSHSSTTTSSSKQFLKTYADGQSSPASSSARSKPHSESVPSMAKRSKENVTVTVRFRPLSPREIRQGEEIAWYADGDTIVRNEHNPSLAYAYDRVFGPTTTTRHVYDIAAQHVVSGAMDGVNGTIFAYGVTSGGKTHTMHGDQRSPGIIPLAVKDAFSIIQETPNREFLLRVSYLEIYNEVVNDLLNPKGQNLRIREDTQLLPFPDSYLQFHVVQFAVNGLKLASPENIYKVIYEALTDHRVGWKKALQLLNERFSEGKKIGKEDDKPCILLIDELDFLVTRNQLVLYNILDWPTRAIDNADPDGYIEMTSGIANTMDLPEKLLPRISSRMGKGLVAMGDIDAAIQEMFQAPHIQVMKSCSKVNKIFLTAMVHELYKTGMVELYKTGMVETTFEKLATTVSLFCASNGETFTGWDALLKVGYVIYTQEEIDEVRIEVAHYIETLL